ncbi:sphingomyelinase phosphodiesterase D-like [Rhagoletis pomonella]|uniref:sphingomyelinase phosphodiesterase D-like n=1 Tax=Rhagoletis pomonella TaxID=28610 RepID=UPI00177BCA3C|nr:sphingomyelinase phosphodiesterase D-like [Rhagoletis pomonella]
MAAQNCISPFLHTLRMAFLTLPLLIVHTQARIGYFWHITDLHLDTYYSTQGDVMHSVINVPSYEPVLDGLSHSALKESDTKRLEILRNITDLLGRTFSSQFVFPVLGHEDGTNNFRHMGELWRHWLPSEALHTFEKGGYYSIEQTKSRLRIIALNTNFMRHDHKSQPSHLAAVRQRTPNGAGGNGDSEYKTYYYHHGSIHQHHGHSSSDWMSHGGGYGGYGGGHHRGMNAIPALSVGDGGGRVSALSEYETQDAEKQWVWLEEVLIKSKDNKETVYIVGHIPPGSDERHIGLQQNGHTTFTESNNKRYLELVRKYSSIIQGQFFGHLHSDSFRIIYDDNGKPVSWMMISPSVTPRKLNVGSNNPAMRLYKFDTDSGQVLDYTQYFMDLQLANQVGEPNWLPEYNLTHYYALSDISAISLHNFVDRFTSSDGAWFGNALLPKLIARMRVLQQQQQQQKKQQQLQRAALGEKHERQIEFAALVMTRTMATKNEAAIPVTLINARTTAFALLLRILLMLQYALEHSYHGRDKFPLLRGNTKHRPAEDQPSAKITENKIENFCMQRTAMQLKTDNMLLQKGNEMVLLQQPTTLRFSIWCYKSFNIIAVAAAASNDKTNTSTDNNAFQWQMWLGGAHEIVAGNNNRHRPISTIQQQLLQSDCVNYRSLRLELQFLCIFCFIISYMWLKNSQHFNPPGSRRHNTTTNADFDISAPANLIGPNFCYHSLKHQQLHWRSGLCSATQ